MLIISWEINKKLNTVYIHSIDAVRDKTTEFKYIYIDGGIYKQIFNMYMYFNIYEQYIT